MGKSNNPILSQRINDATAYFERFGRKDAELRGIIPELIRMITDLYPLREWQNETDDYIEEWRKSKIRFTRMVPLPNGEIVEAFLSEELIDSSDFRRHIHWLWSYFQREYSIKTQATISYAYAFQTFTQYHNRHIHPLSPNDLPNTKLRDILSAIAAENETNPTAVSVKTDAQIVDIDNLEQEAQVSLEYIKTLKLDDVQSAIQEVLLWEVMVNKISKLKSESSRIKWNGRDHPTLSFLYERLTMTDSQYDMLSAMQDFIRLKPDKMLQTLRENSKYLTDWVVNEWIPEEDEKTPSTIQEGVQQVKLAALEYEFA